MRSSPSAPLPIRKADGAAHSPLVQPSRVALNAVHPGLLIANRRSRAEPLRISPQLHRHQQAAQHAAGTALPPLSPPLRSSGSQPVLSSAPPAGGGLPSVAGSAQHSSPLSNNVYLDSTSQLADSPTSTIAPPPAAHAPVQKRSRFPFARASAEEVSAADETGPSLKEILAREKAAEERARELDPEVVTARIAQAKVHKMSALEWCVRPRPRARARIHTYAHAHTYAFEYVWRRSAHHSHSCHRPSHTTQCHPLCSPPHTHAPPLCKPSFHTRDSGGGRQRVRLDEALEEANSAIDATPNPDPSLYELRSLVEYAQRDFGAALEDAARAKALLHAAAAAAAKRRATMALPSADQALEGEQGGSAPAADAPPGPTASATAPPPLPPAAPSIRTVSLLREARALTGLGRLNDAGQSFIAALDRAPTDPNLGDSFGDIIPRFGSRRYFLAVPRRVHEKVCECVRVCGHGGCMHVCL